MKIKYKVLWIVLVIEIIMFNIMKSLGIVINSWFFNGLATFCMLAPILLLLGFYKRDSNSTVAKLVYNVIFWFLIICFIAGGIITGLEIIFS